MRCELATCLVLSSALLGQETVPAKAAGGSMGIDFTNQYFFRGIARENQGIIAQPWLELGYGLWDGSESIKNLRLTFGLWNSLHDGPTGADNGNGIWFESDFHAGLAATLSERWSVGATYTAYHSPNGLFGTFEEVAFALGLDDKNLITDAVASGLQPTVVIAIETDGQADGGNHVGIYGQLAIEPSFALGKLGQLDVTLAVPVTLGLSLSDYYQDVTTGGDDDAFGFFDVGVVASSALPFLPSRMGPWSGELGLHWLLLGDNNEERNVGDTSELIVSFGLSTTF
jgi:hypothetical protein